MATAGGLKPTARLKVLFILDAFPDPHAGTEGQFWLLFNHLDRARFDPAILLLRPSAFLQEHVKDAPVHVLDVHSLRSPRALWRILRAVRRARREGYRLAHIFFNDSALVFPPLLKLAGLKVIVSRRDLGFWYTPMNLRLLRVNTRFVDAVVANCEAVKDVVVREEGFSPERVHVVYNGITRREHAPAVDVRARMGLPPQSQVLVLVANLRPLKRIDDAIRALALLGAEICDAHLLVAGEDREGRGGRSHRDELADLAVSLGVDGRVHFLGKLADPMPVIRAADVCLLCSETEGLSNTIIEYMFAGKPVVCTDVGGNSELIRSGWSGIVVGAGDAGQLSAAIAELLGDNERRELYGRNARQRALEAFSTNAMAVKQASLYEAQVPIGPIENVPEVLP